MFSVSVTKTGSVFVVKNKIKARSNRQTTTQLPSAADFSDFLGCIIVKISYI